jgi:hypothetical protein
MSGIRRGRRALFRVCGGHTIISSVGANLEVRVSPCVQQSGAGLRLTRCARPSASFFPFMIMWIRAPTDGETDSPEISSGCRVEQRL